MPYLDLKTLRLPDNNNDANWWADHIEFFCLVSKDQIITVEQVADRLLDDHSNQPARATASISGQEEFDEFVDSIEREALQEDDDEGNSDHTLLDSVASDSLSARIQQHFDFLKRRSEIFGNAYPFEVTSKSILVRSKALSILQYLYTALLCSSLLKYATRSGINRMGHHFEDLCGPAFKRLVPRGCTVRFFGSGSSDVHGFTGSFYQKVETLAGMLHVELGGDFTTATISRHNVGDGGLDWVGFYDFADKQKFQPKFFAQCACGINWAEKQFDAHFDKWSRYMQLDNGYLLYHFVPRSLRTVVGDFVNPTEIYSVTMIDRLRLIEILRSESRLGTYLYDIYMEFFDELHSNKLDSFD